jgi:hypothetical protein
MDVVAGFWIWDLADPFVRLPEVAHGGSCIVVTGKQQEHKLRLPAPTIRASMGAASF